MCKCAINLTNHQHGAIKKARMNTQKNSSECDAFERSRDKKKEKEKKNTINMDLYLIPQRHYYQT